MTATALAALSDPVGRAIFERLRTGRVVLSNQSGVSQTAVSIHLKLARLESDRREGRQTTIPLDQDFKKKETNNASQDEKSSNDLS